METIVTDKDGGARTYSAETYMELQRAINMARMFMSRMSQEAKDLYIDVISESESLSSFEFKNIDGEDSEKWLEAFEAIDITESIYASKGGVS